MANKISLRNLLLELGTAEGRRVAALRGPEYAYLDVEEDRNQSLAQLAVENPLCIPGRGRAGPEKRAPEGYNGMRLRGDDPHLRQKLEDISDYHARKRRRLGIR